MRVGIFVGTSPAVGGVSQVEKSILTALRDCAGGSGHQFFLLADRHFPDIEMMAADHVAPVILFAGADSLRRRIACRIPGMASSLDVQVPNSILNLYTAPIKRVIERQGIQALYFIAHTDLCYQLDRPYVLTVFDLQHRVRPEFPEVSWGGRWEKRDNFFARAIGQASAVIVDSEVGKEDVFNYYRVSPDRVHVLPQLAAPFARVKWDRDPLALQPLGLRPGYLFLPAQFWAHKNHANVLLALRHLRDEQGLVLPLVMVGSDKGTLRYVQELVQRLDLADQVRHLGFVTDQVMACLYHHALALVFPTFFGPTNLPPLEAFSLDCPVITSNIRGVRDQVGDAALTVDPGDPRDIARAVLAIHSSADLRAALIERGRALIAGWGPSQYAQGIVSILDGMATSIRTWTWV